MKRNKTIILLIFFCSFKAYADSCSSFDAFILDSCGQKLCHYIKKCGEDEEYICRSVGGECPDLNICKKQSFQIQKSYVMADQLSRFSLTSSTPFNSDLNDLLLNFRGVETSETTSINLDDLTLEEKELATSLPLLPLLIRRGLQAAQVMGPVYLKYAWEALKEDVQRESVEVGYAKVVAWAKEQQKLYDERNNDKEKKNELNREKELEWLQRNKVFLEEMVKDREVKRLQGFYSQKMKEIMELNMKNNGSPLNLEQFRKDIEKINKNYENDMNAHEQKRRNQKADKQNESEKKTERAGDRIADKVERENRQREERENRQREERENRQREERENRQREERENRQREERENRQREERENRQREERENKQRDAKDMNELQERLGKPGIPSWLNFYNLFTPLSEQELKEIERKEFDL